MQECTHIHIHIHGHSERASPEEQTSVTQATETSSQGHTDRERKADIHLGKTPRSGGYSDNRQVRNKALEM